MEHVNDIKLVRVFNKRFIHIEDVKLKLSIVTMLKIKNKTIFHLDELPNGTFRLTYSEDMIKDIQKFEFIIRLN